MSLMKMELVLPSVYVSLCCHKTGLCIPKTGLRFGGGVLGISEKNSFIALTVKVESQWLMP